MADCSFRVGAGVPELWNPMTGEIRQLSEFKRSNGSIQIPLQFEPYESYFVVFNRSSQAKTESSGRLKNFTGLTPVAELTTPWRVSFDPKWGGPANITFERLEDWSKRPEEGIKFYSGIASYFNSISISKEIVGKKGSEFFLDLGEVCNLARVLVNGKDLGVLWTAPYRIKITEALVPGDNKIEIQVANLWPNRLIGDEQKPDDGIKNGQWPEWLQKGTPRTSGRFTFATYRHFKKDAALLKSGLIGPVKILKEED
jgi:hypothetical protein